MRANLRSALRIVFTAVIAASLVQPMAAGHLGAALVGWWKFDEAGGSVAADASGLGNDGMLLGDIGFTTDSLLGNAVDVTGDSGAVIVPPDASLEPAEGTIEAWFKVAALQDADLLGKVSHCRIRTAASCPSGVGFSVFGLRIRADGGFITFIANDDPANPSVWTTIHTAPGLYMADAWHHVAIRWDGSTFAIFVDGMLQEQESYNPIPGAGLSYFGETPFFLASPTAGPSGGEFQGQLDDVRFYGRGRRDVEIFTDYVTKGHKPAKPPGR